MALRAIWGCYTIWISLTVRSAGLQTNTTHIHFHVRSEGRIVKQTVYIAIGINMDGGKDVLGMYVGQNESAKFWLSILNGLKNRGVEDILIACVDGLFDFPLYKDIKPLMADLKNIRRTNRRNGIVCDGFFW